MAQISFTWDSRDLELWRGEPKVEKALASALSKAGGDAVRALRADSVRSVRSRKRFKAAKLRRALPLFFPRGRKIESLLWEMKVSGEPVPVSSLPHRQTRKGVSVAINTGKRSFIRSAFIATMKSGHTGVFLRRGAGRLPIDEAFTTKVSDVFNDTGMIPDVMQTAERAFDKAFTRLWAIEVGKLR